LFQRYRGDLCLQNIIDDPSSPSKKIVNILFASGEALQAMHARGYLHTDFKPRNVVFNSSAYTLALVDLEFMLSIKDGATGVNQLAGTATFQHPDWRRASIRNFYSGAGVKYTPKNDLYAFLVTADTCLGTAYSHADADYRETLIPAWIQIRQWKDLPYAGLPTLTEVMNTLNQLLTTNNINLMQVQPEEQYNPRRSPRMK
jgi:serine/threonine protein kinase